MTSALAPFLGGWTVMMAAMMLPSAAPMVLLHRRALAGSAPPSRDARTALFVAPYLLVWAAMGVLVWIVSTAVAPLMPMPARPAAVGAVLLAAGVYQFTPLKAACLHACRSPMDFLLTHWHRGLVGELRLGAEHGLYCLGCCWLLMTVFVAAFAMGPLWGAVIGLVVFVEKVVPNGVAFGRVIGVLLMLAGIVVFVRPDLAALLPGAM